ncbi:MAG: CHAT domain-containing protein [Saprospiraceae bacterium]|nr:CHAT domain-containing protein [Saprospiraceae bacterium]
MKKLLCLALFCFLAQPWIVLGQNPCDSIQIQGLLKESANLLDRDENQAGLSAALKAWELLSGCPGDSVLWRKAYLQTDHSYRSLATETVQKGLFNRTIDLAERDIALHLRMPNPVTDHLSTGYMLLANAHNLNGNQQLAIEALRKGLQVRHNANSFDPKISAFYEQLTNNYIALEDSAGVKKVLLEWEAFYRKIGKRGGLQAPVGLAVQWAMYYEMIGRPDLGAQKLEDTLSVYAEALKTKATFLGLAEFQLCELYAQTRNFKKSLFYSEKNVKLQETRLREQKGKLFTRSHYAWYLAQSARTAWNLYLETGDTAFYQLALQRTETSEKELRAMRDRTPDDGFRDWIGNRVGIVANLMEVRHGLYRQTGDLRHAALSFESVEASKMFAIQEFLHETYALQWGGVPDSLYQQEDAYRQEINALESNFFFKRGHPKADSLLAANDRELFIKRDLYRVFLKKLEQQYPDYFQLKYRQSAVRLQDVQTQMLHPDECLLDMSLENNNIFLLLIRTDTVIWLALPFSDSLEQALRLVEKGSRQFLEWQQLPEPQYLKQMQAYTTAAHRAYLELIAPVRAQLKEKVLLVPRDRLAGFPFGALLTQPNAHPAKPFQWHFMDQEFVLSEIYSASLFRFLQTRNPRQKLPGTVLAMAPFDQSAPEGGTTLPAGDVADLTRTQVFSALPATGLEAQKVARMGKGKALLGRDASKLAFQEQCGRYEVLHMATHSVANEVLGEYSFVALQTAEKQNQVDLLFARDIYGLRLSAELVVLSACETALGQYRENEGVVGLTRAFQCAGARNVASSLWTVNDASTSTLMVFFHEEIQKGQSYNVALAKAKRRFIQTKRQQAHPYYWAGFVLHGR